MSWEQPVFYYDLGNPWCYLAAERVTSALPVAAEWEPVLGAVEREPDRDTIDRLASDRGLLRVRWPPSWPPRARTAMLAATYAKRIGRAVAFSLAAFRLQFAGGRDLGEVETVLLAAAACEMHPSAVLRGIELRSVGEALDRACARALRAGVESLPAVQLGDRIFEGDAGIDAAAHALGAWR